VDIQISPDNTRVYLDGRYIGVADDFDGDPDYLHLRPGAYKLGFKLEGYESWSLGVDVEPGAKIEVNKKLHRAAESESYRSSEALQPEGGVRHFWGKNEGGTLKPEDDDRGAARNEQDSRDPNADDEDADEPPAPAPEESADDDKSETSTDAPPQPTRLELSIEPSDAVVYLDGHFVGTAAEVSDARHGVALTPGRHTISVLRPGSRDRTEEIEVGQGETKKLEISLEE
jgi:hypothetical protein